MIFRAFFSERIAPWAAGVACALVLVASALPRAALGAGASPPTTGVSAPQAEGERALERRVKAAFLFRFTEFVTWPEAAFSRSDSPFTIAVAGRDALAEEIRQITAGRTVGGRQVEVRRVGDTDGHAGAQMVFVAEPEKQRLREWVRTAARHALIVSEAEGSLGQGSVINFIVVEGRVRFEISLEWAEKRGLRMSSRLLAVAHGVHNP